MTGEEHKLLSDKIKEAKKEVSKEPKKAKEILMQTGFYTPAGKLKKACRSETKKQNAIFYKISCLAEKGLCSREDAEYIKDVILGLDERFGVDPKEILTVIKNQLVRNSVLEDWPKNSSAD